MATGVRSLEENLSRTSVALLRPTGLLLVAAYLVFAADHLLLLEGATRTMLASSALTTALVALCVAFLPALRRGQRADLALVALATLAWGNSALHIALEPEIRHTTNFAIVLFGLGVLITRRRWFYPLLLMVLASWVGLVQALAIADGEHWVRMLAMVTAVAVVAHELRRGLLRQGLAREAQLRRHAEELQNLVQSPELAGPRPEPVFERIVAAAQQTLGVGRAGIWLLSSSGDRISLAALQDDRGPETERFATALERSVAPAYFTALDSARTIAIEDAPRDARTRELAEAISIRWVWVPCSTHRSSRADAARASCASSIAVVAASGPSRSSPSRRRSRISLRWRCRPWSARSSSSAPRPQSAWSPSVSSPEASPTISTTCSRL